MGFIKALKEVAEKLRERGKSNQEILSIIETASDKATIKKPCEVPKVEMIVPTTDLKEALMAAGITTEDAAKAISGFRQSTRITVRKDTNNWRRMHGLPMRRKRRRQRGGNGKRADCNTKNADVS